jgi:hypothetical protein
VPPSAIETLPPVPAVPVVPVRVVGNTIPWLRVVGNTVVVLPYTSAAVLHNCPSPLFNCRHSAIAVRIEPVSAIAEAHLERET